MRSLDDIWHDEAKQRTRELLYAVLVLLAAGLVIASLISPFAG